MRNQNEWTEKDFEDFLADFAGVRTQSDIFEKSQEIYLEQIENGHDAKSALAFSEGYERALLDIFKQK